MRIRWADGRDYAAKLSTLSVVGDCPPPGGQEACDYAAKLSTVRGAQRL